MAIEKFWAEVLAQPIIQDSTASGQVFVSLSTLFKVGQNVVLKAAGNPDKLLKVKAISNLNTIELGARGHNIRHREDLSAYTLASGATIHADKQSRPPISTDDIIRSIFEEEPTVALRTILVDEIGDPHSASNPISVVGNLELGDPVETPLIRNISCPNKNVENAVPIPAGVKKLSFYARNNSKLQFSFNSGESGVAFKTLMPGNVFQEDGIELNGKTLYVQASKDGEILEILTWT